MKRQGLSIIEVIAAMILVTMISATFYAFLGSQIDYFNTVHDHAIDKMAAQKQLSQNIQASRQAMALIDDPAAAVGLQSIRNAFVDGLTVYYKEESSRVDNMSLDFLVGYYQPELLAMPQIESVDVDLYYRGKLKAYGARGDDQTKLYGRANLLAGTEENHLINTYQWYQTNKQFSIPIQNTTEEERKLYALFPQFPEDYSIISHQKRPFISDASDYRGRQLALEATPISSNYNSGLAVDSEPILIDGLPVYNSDLILHLDASQIDVNARDEVSGELAARRVKNWRDLSSYALELPAYNRTGSIELQQRLNNAEFNARFVNFDKNDEIRYDVITGSTLLDMHIFSVTYGELGTQYLHADNDDLYIDGQMINSKPLTNPSQAHSAVWRVNYHQNFIDVISWLRLGRANFDLAELIVYRGNLAPSDRVKILEYLKEKYAPLIKANEVDTIYDLEESVVSGAIFSMPKAAMARTIYGLDAAVKVEFDEVLTASAPGVYSARGHLAEDDTKTFTYRLHVNTE